MPKPWPKEVAEWIKQNAYGRSAVEIQHSLYELFGFESTPKRIKSYCLNHNIPRLVHPITPEIEQYIRDNIEGAPHKEIYQAIRDKFGYDSSFGAYKRWCSVHGIKNGIDSRYQKGWNNPRKGKTWEGPHPGLGTQFKKGQKPANTRGIGAERICDGRVYVKVDEATWKQKNRIVWEQAHGPIGRGTIIKHLDGNPLNCELSNLKAIDQRIQTTMNYCGYNKVEPELIPAAIMAAELEVLTKEKKKNGKSI